MAIAGTDGGGGPRMRDDSGFEATTRPWPVERWLFFHALAAALAALVWLADEPIFRFVNAWYNGPEPLNGELHQLVLSLAMFGQTLGIVVSIALIWLLDATRRGRIAYVSAALIAAGLGSSTLKTLVGRDRPVECQGQTIVHGPTKGITQSRHQSFPSGHTATAFALTVCLTRFYPRLAPMAWLFAIGVGCNRILTVRHFPSDVVAGGWIGFTLAAGVFRISWLNQLASNLDIALSPNAPWRNAVLHQTANVHLVRWRHCCWRAVAGPGFLLCSSLVINLVGNAATPLWDRDEPRFATATREMIERGDWIVPTFNGDLRTDKPILIYWLMRGAYMLFGDNPFAARLVSSVAGAVACLLTYGLAQAMFGRRVAILAGWMLALSPMLIVESKLATVDALLLAEIAGCQWILWRIVSQPGDGKSRSARWLWLLLGLAVLTKGPVALAIVGVTLLGFGAIRHEWSWLRRLEPWSGLAILAVVVLPWAVAVQVLTGGEFLRHSLGHHVVSRSLTPLENHRGFPGYYVVSVLGMMAPWGFFLPLAIAAGWKKPRRDPRFAFLAAWAIGTLLLFEAVRTKLVHYYLPAYPALALWLAASFVDRQRMAWPIGRLRQALYGCLRVGGCIVAAVAVMAAALAFSRDAKAPLVVAGILFGGGICVAAELLSRHRARYAFVAACASLASCWIVIGAWLVPAIGTSRLTYLLADRLAIERDRGKPLGLWQFREPSLVYNLKGPVKVVDPMDNAPYLKESLEYALRTGGFVCPVTTPELQSMRTDPKLRLRVIDELAGIDVTGCKCRTISIVEVRPATAQIADHSDDSQNLTR